MRHDRHYTLDEARAELGWVAAQLAAMRRARAALTDAEARAALAEAAPGNGGGRPGKRVGDAFVELQVAAAAFQARDIVLRDLDRGLVDFPALRAEHEIYLCWVDGEPDIGFWHELDAGIAGRQAL
jgi:nicotinamide mononucleotide (NMN) deamidase PncC